MQAAGRSVLDICKEVLQVPAFIALPAANAAAATAAFGCSLAFDGIHPKVQQALAAAPADPIKYVIDDERELGLATASTLLVRLKLSAALQ